ncbi:MAG: thiamine pyrophosphate-requiring protein [Alicyclobacillaceae bacterium]|nr:thiamine pyrophosphate-requiring protein [Alicyclobacillaceae bacterium]
MGEQRQAGRLPWEPTAADVLMTTLHELGVDCIFANLGSDHPALIESWAKFRAHGVPMPEVVVCPHEMVAMSAAHGYAQATGRLQAVLVHVDVGTQNVGGALHNAMRGRVPVLMVAGASPVTLDGELVGSRNEPIHYLQDVFDQRGIVREYVKWNLDLHSGQNIDLVVKRAAQVALSEPRGPVYLLAPREMLEEKVVSASRPVRELLPVRPAGLDPAGAREIAAALAEAEFPLVIASYAGRNWEAVEELVGLSNDWAIPVVESRPFYMNFPGDHPLHLGFDVQTYLSRADVVLVLDSDLPWMPQTAGLKPSAKLYWVDSDPIKERIPLWYYSGESAWRADAAVALRQIREALSHVQGDAERVRRRRAFAEAEAKRLRAEWASREGDPGNGVITPEYLTSTLRDFIDDDTVVVNETVSNYGVVCKHLRFRKPGSFLGSGGSSLGWHGGAAIGVKLARPDQTVVALTGDGSYVFSVPSAVHMVSAKYRAPFLTVIYNNGGWKSPKLSTLAVHPQGTASRRSDFRVEFDSELRLERAAEVAPGVMGLHVSHPSELRPALSAAFEHVRGGHSAVVNVKIQPL